MPSFKLFLVGAVYFDETCMLSLRFGQVPKQTEPPWNRSVSTFHLVCRDILLELRIATAENSGKISTKINKTMFWLLDSLLSLFLFRKLLFAHYFFTFSLCWRFCSLYLQFAVIMDTRYGLQKSASDGTRRIPNPRNWSSSSTPTVSSDVTKKLKTTWD